jgi:hypothetical protein
MLEMKTLNSGVLETSSADKGERDVCKQVRCMEVDANMYYTCDNAF